MSKLESYNYIWEQVNDSFNQTRQHPELNEISYLLADFRDYLTDVIDELEYQEDEQ